MKPAEELRSLFARAGITASSEVIAF